MKIFLHKLVKQPLLWAFLLMLGLWYGAFKIFESNEQVPILAAISTGLVVMFGYFATHYLTISRNQKEEKFKLCLELIKKIRFFILEENHKGTEKQGMMRDELQDAYFSFSLLTSEASYSALSEMMKKFGDHLLNCKELCINACEFKKAQSIFVNKLRKEFFTDREIKFETYDFRLKKKE